MAGHYVRYLIDEEDPGDELGNTLVNILVHHLNTEHQFFASNQEPVLLDPVINLTQAGQFFLNTGSGRIRILKYGTGIKLILKNYLKP